MKCVVLLFKTTSTLIIAHLDLQSRLPRHFNSNSTSPSASNQKTCLEQFFSFRFINFSTNIAFAAFFHKPARAIFLFFFLASSRNGEKFACFKFSLERLIWLVLNNSRGTFPQSEKKTSQRVNDTKKE